ncbi:MULTISPECIES: Glu/Leu/Phe/Val dehydrogenase dimerization domain-containing protein [unclassified Streptomyces]|uniref:Glu/Leu/Phe/Val dehydrogenase dimerization domain-containing protein n=1 Tax=unclassified Streptomyces TaxID=2593676 RepID=UPI003316B7CA
MSTTIHYADPVEGFEGWLVYDGHTADIAAGGFRVQPGVTEELVASLAARMTLKQRVLGLGVDGAKAGIDYDPAAPGKAAAVRRFLAFLREELAGRFSMGCDMGTRWHELEELAALEAIPSIKYVVKQAQGISDHDFFTRLRTLDTPVGALTLGQRRAGHALAHAALAAARRQGRRPETLTCSLQGFGNMGRAAAYSLLEQGVRITAVADAHACVVDPRGLDIARMLETEQSRAVDSIAPGALRLPRETLLDLPADVLILAAGENAITDEQARVLPCPVVVVGSNHGLGADVEQTLADHGVLVVPDFIGGIGGSASIDALFGPYAAPDARQVLDSVAAMMDDLLDDLLSRARNLGQTPRQAALDFAAVAVDKRGQRPYGTGPYAQSALRRASRGRRTVGTSAASGEAR